MQPFYNPLLAYEENYRFGPFGYFLSGKPLQPTKHKTSFLGYSLDVPFGIASGPLLNSRFVKAAWKNGFSLATYKTVRSSNVDAHSYPNIVRIDQTNGLKVEPNETVYGSLDWTTFNIERHGITNSFGVPSKTSSEWQEDVRSCIETMGIGNVLIVSFMGTKNEQANREHLIEDYVRACRLTVKSDAPILEMNVSCPNIGKAGMLCHDVKTMEDILESLNKTKNNKPLLVKLGYFHISQQNVLESILESIHRFANGVVAINTIQARVINYRGKQELTGDALRLISGICGAPIRWAGLEMAQRIVAYKKKKGWKDFVVVGVGGVVSVDDYWEYMKRGVDAVQSATGAMWKPDLANEIRTSVAKSQRV